MAIITTAKSSSESGSEYLPAASDEEYNDDSSESGDSDDSDIEQPVVEQGWHLLSDTRCDPMPSFSDAHTLLFFHVAQFTCSCEAFLSVF